MTRALGSLSVLALIFSASFFIARESAQASPENTETPAVAGPATLTEVDQNAIIEVIETESKHFYNRNFPEWSNQYTSEVVKWICVEENGVVLEAYDKPGLDKLVGDYIAANPQPEAIQIDRSEYQWMPLDGNYVWVSFHEIQKTADKVKTIEGLRIMKKENEGWKIAGMLAALSKVESTAAVQ